MMTATEYHLTKATSALVEATEKLYRSSINISSILCDSIKSEQYEKIKNVQGI